MSEEFKDNLSNTDNWIRLLLVILFVVVFWLGAWVLGLVVALGLVILMISGKRNENLSRFGEQLSEYLTGIMAYATLNSDQQPFPFGEWPSDANTPVSATPDAPPAHEEPPPVDPPAAPKKTTAKAKKKTSRKKTSKKSV